MDLLWTPRKKCTEKKLSKARINTTPPALHRTFSYGDSKVSVASLVAGSSAELSGENGAAL